MIKRQFLFVTSLFLGIALVLPAAPVAKADPLGALTQYNPSSGTPSWTSMVEGHDGNLWVAQKSPMSIFVMTKSGSVLNTYPLPSSITHITSMTRGADGNIWFTNSSLKYGKISPTGNVDVYSPSWVLGGLSNIVFGPDGYMYMGVANGGGQNGLIHKIDSATGQLVKTYNTGFQSTLDRITVDHASGLMWFLTSGSVGNFDTDGNIHTYAIPGVYAGSGGSITMGPDGRPWFVLRSNNVGSINVDGTFSTIYPLPVWYQSYTDSIATGLDGNLWVSGGGDGSIIRITTTGIISKYSASGGLPSQIHAGSDGNVWFFNGLVKKISKIGTGVTGSTVDVDGDGLNASQEHVQGTSDFSVDTDGDGLSDFLESTSYLNRDNVFCGTSCAYPNPTMKDLYVEIDWMTHGSFSAKPTSGDLAGAVLAYGNKGIKIHFDTGSFGGGNEVEYAAVVKGEPDDTVRDFYDYKLGGDGLSAQFSPDRYHIWRYMLSADELTNNDNETDLIGLGVSGDDDTLLGYGRLSADDSGPALQAEVGQTIIHELGHNLCLSSTASYAGHDASCVYAYIDSDSAPATYASAMKYNGTVLDLSMGTNISTGDHDDWRAVLNKGFDDFAISDRGDEEHNSLNSQSRGTNKKAPKRLFASTKARQ